MERRSFIRKTGLAGILAAGAAPAVVNAQATIRWRIAWVTEKRQATRR